MSESRFDLVWHLPLELGLMTHVTLFDTGNERRSMVAIGHGWDEADALLDLWTMLTRRGDDAAIAYVASAYTKRTGERPTR